MDNKDEGGGVVEAEKGKNLSPHNLHMRLRVLEVVVLISLVLNLFSWYLSADSWKKADNLTKEGPQRVENR